MSGLLSKNKCAIDLACSMAADDNKIIKHTTNPGVILSVRNKSLHIVLSYERN